MQTRNQNMMNRRSHRHSGRNRASAVILVVVSLVLMALLGAAYLQQTRVQRFVMSEPGGDIETVVDAAISQIQQTLVDDLTDKGDGSFELYDYPWTNEDGGIQVGGDFVNRFDVFDFDGNLLGEAVGGFQDDMWLAASEPADLGGTPVWPHITNLTGLYLSYDRENNRFIDTDSDGIPDEHVVNHSGGNNHTDIDLDINISNAPGFLQLVDASGDGVPDSRWTWAPIQQIDGVNYVMAVRIVDLSGKINVNTAMSLTDTGGTIDDADTNDDRPRWDTPAELDLGRFVYERDSGLMTTELDDLLERRVDGGNFDVPTTRQQRLDYWQDQGRYTVSQPNYLPFGLRDEYELRHRDGLNSEYVRSIIASGEGMPTLLRDTPEERQWDDPATIGTLEEFYVDEPRKHLTTRSGAAIFRWPLPGAGDAFDREAVDSHLKHDLNDAALTTIRDAVESVYSTNWPVMMPGGFGTTSADIKRMAAQFAANVANYRADTGMLVGVLPDGFDPSTAQPEDWRYGLMPLPIITEVYTQAKYEMTQTEEQLDEANDDASFTPPQWNITWEQEGQTGYAIEIRNPFEQSIDLKQVQLWVNGVAWLHDDSAGANDYPTDEDAAVMLSDLARDENDEPIERLGPNEVLILYRNSAAGTAWDRPKAGDSQHPYEWEEADGTATPPRQAGPDWRDNMIEHGEEGGNIIWAALPNEARFNWPGASGTAATRDVRIELRPVIRWQNTDEEDVEEIADWPHFVAEAYAYPSTVVAENVESDNDPMVANAVAYWQHTVFSDGRGLNPLAMGDDSVGLNLEDDEFLPEWEPQAPDETLPSMQPVVNSSPVDRSEYVSQIGEADKGRSDHNSDLDDLRLSVPGEEVRHVGALAHLAVLGPNATATLTEEWRAAVDFAVNHADDSALPPGYYPTDMDADDIDPEQFGRIFMLDFNPAIGLVGDGSSDQANHAVTHAAMLIDRFTTLSPVAAGVGEDEGGLMVPGLVNLNTMPEHLLWEVLPIADDNLRGEVATRIINYRDGDASARATLLGAGSINEVRPNPGIANTGELFKLLEGLADDGSNLPAEATRQDQVKLAKWLSQVGSARSDYFAAYIYVRGYQDGLMDQSPADNPEAIREAMRVIAVFERNAADGEVRVVALLPNNQPYEVK